MPCTLNCCHTIPCPAPGWPNYNFNSYDSSVQQASNKRPTSVQQASLLSNSQLTLSYFWQHRKAFIFCRTGITMMPIPIHMDQNRSWYAFKPERRCFGSAVRSWNDACRSHLPLLYNFSSFATAKVFPPWMPLDISGPAVPAFVNHW